MSIQKPIDKQKFSLLRKALIELAGEITPLVQTLLSDKPMIKGSVYELKRKCGKATCKCTKGQLHRRMVLSASEGGKTKLKVIPAGFLSEVKLKVKKYQAFRRKRARMGELHIQMLQIIDEMEAMRREEMSSLMKKEKDGSTDEKKQEEHQMKDKKGVM